MVRRIRYRDEDGLEYEVKKIDLSRKESECPVCHLPGCKRHSVGFRRLYEIGFTQPVLLEVTYSKHYCGYCDKHFNLPMNHLADPGSSYTNRVKQTSVYMVQNEGMTLEDAIKSMLLKYSVDIPPSTLHDWLEAKKNK